MRLRFKLKKFWLRNLRLRFNLKKFWLRNLRLRFELKNYCLRNLRLRFTLEKFWLRNLRLRFTVCFLNAQLCFWKALALVALVLGLEHSCSWPRECPVLRKAVLKLGLGFFFCPWPRALCPRLHPCSNHRFKIIAAQALSQVK